MASYNVEVVPSPLCIMGEGPHWDIERQSLYYNNIYGSSIHRYDFKENKVYNATVGELIQPTFKLLTFTIYMITFK
jgi:gluconolactonase